MAEEKAVRKEYFYIRSEMNNKVLEAEGTNENAHVVTNDKVIQDHQHPDSQLWYRDQNQVIRSKWNDFAMENIPKDGSTRAYIGLNPYRRSNSEQQWQIYNVGANTGKIALKDTNLCVDIADKTNENGAWVIPFGYGGHNNQLWYFDVNIL